MKKFCVFFFLIFLLIQAQVLCINKYQFSNCYASEETTTYAKASAVCTLYKTTTMSEEISNIYFVIPETYFVTILEVVSDNCLKVQYGGFVGYVDSSTVVVATFIPIVKTLEGITCDIKDTSGTQIWSEPSATSTVLTTIPAGTKNIRYIASAFGRIPSGGESNLWYYVSFTPESNSTNVYEGYIYSENVTNLSEIVPNTETNPEVITNKNGDDYMLNISSPVRAIIITLIAVPVIILILIIIYKASKKIGNKKSLNQKQEVENIPPAYGYNNYENSSYENNHLKEEIQHMSVHPYVRKMNQRRYDEQKSYPVFPTYDSDDDLL